MVMDRILERSKYLWSKSNRFHKVILLFVVLNVVPLPSSKYGFYCNDPALSHPFSGDTINWKWLIGVCSLLPLPVMLLTERICNKENSNRALMWYIEYLFGFILNLCIVHILKDSVGSPRPHFFDTCKSIEATTCKGSEFVSNYTCSKSKWQWQSDKSFPSGHTSLAVFAGMFIAYYLHKRAPRGLVVRTGQAACAGLAAWCGVSRVTDHRHHWWDVAAGAVIGVAMLIYTTQRQCRKFNCSEENPSSTTSLQAM